MRSAIRAELRASYSRYRLRRGHFRVEHQNEGEAKRNDDEFSYVGAWGYSGDTAKPTLHKEWLDYEEVHFSTRSYK